MVNSHIVDANGLPMMDGQYKNSPALTTLDANNIPHTDLTVYTDPRLDVSTGRFNTPFWDWTVPSSLDGWVRDCHLDIKYRLASPIGFTCDVKLLICVSQFVFCAVIVFTVRHDFLQKALDLSPTVL